jgi:hypothetical protein
MARVNKIMLSTGARAAELGLVKDRQGNLADSKQDSLQLLLTKHFADNTPTEAVLVQDEPDEPTFVPQMPWITKERFRTVVNAYKKGKAPGTDEFCAECLQSMDNLTVEHILNIFNAYLALKYVPKQWRDLNVIFIPKPGKNDYTDRST